MGTITGFIKDYNNQILLPITRAELVKTIDGECAFRSWRFAADEYNYGLMSPEDYEKLRGEGNQSLSGLSASIQSLSNSIKVDETLINLLSTSPALHFVKSSQIIPELNGTELTFKLVNTVQMNSATVQTVDEEQNTSVVNKGWVQTALEDKFQEALNVASGGLHFEGVLDEDLTNALLDKHSIGSYFIISGSHECNESIVSNGDTAIIYNDNGTKKWIVVPSGNEIITRLKATSDGSTELSGQILLTSDTPALHITTGKVTGADGGIKFTIDPASFNSSGTLNPGLFTNDLYKSLASEITTGVTYTPMYDVDNGVHIGTIGESNPVYTPKLVVTNDVNNSEWYVGYKKGASKIKFAGGPGVIISGSALNGTISTSLNVAQDQPLKLSDDGQLELNVWKVGDGATNSQGLITFETLAQGIGDNVLFVEVGNPESLSPSERAYLDYSVKTNSD